MECGEINLSAAENKRGAGGREEGRGGVSELNLPSYNLTVKPSVVVDVSSLGQEAFTPSSVIRRNTSQEGHKTAPLLI